MAELSSKTYNEQLAEITDRYRDSGQPWPATARQIAIWAINQGHYQFQREKIIAKAAEEFAAAMREVYFTDPQGRRVRALHAARSKQQTLWDDMRSAPREHMERAFQDRRRQVVGECKHLRTDVDSYNDNHPEENPIQLILDFTDDVAEGMQPINYHPNNPR